ncbi:hypothetical protein V8C44DRAFT_323300 [Trichoderma aethiopicum]
MSAWIFGEEVKRRVQLISPFSSAKTEILRSASCSPANEKLAWCLDMSPVDDSLQWDRVPLSMTTLFGVSRGIPVGAPR